MSCTAFVKLKTDRNIILNIQIPMVQIINDAVASPTPLHRHDGISKKA